MKYNTNMKVLKSYDDFKNIQLKILPETEYSKA